MATEVKLPRLGQGMESGTIVRWLKAEGDAVKKREPLYELDTDKVTQEVESEVDGVLLEIVVAEGEVEVGSTIAMIGTDGDEPAEPDEPAAPDAADDRGRHRSRARRTPAADARVARTPSRSRRRCRQRRQRGPAEAGSGRSRSRRRRSRGGSRASAASISRRSRARARTAASSPRTSRTLPSAPRRPPPRSPALRRSGEVEVVAADLDPQDDRAAAHRGLDGAGLPARRLDRHDRGPPSARAARRPSRRRAT